MVDCQRRQRVGKFGAINVRSDAREFLPSPAFFMKGAGSANEQFLAGS
jgi:hypothetical protein